MHMVPPGHIIIHRDLNDKTDPRSALPLGDGSRANYMTKGKLRDSMAKTFLFFLSQIVLAILTKTSLGGRMLNICITNHLRKS